MEDWRARDVDVDAINAARCGDPFAVLGPHLTSDGWAIRVFAPDALRGARADPRRGTPRGAAAAQGRFLRGAGPLRQGAAALSRRGRVAAGNLVLHRRLRLRAGARAGRRLSPARGIAPPALSPPRRAAHDARGRRRRAVRALGAQRDARLGGRRLQPLGRPALPDAQALRQRPVGDLRSPHRRRNRLQVRTLRARRRPAAAEGRSVRLRGRAPALDRLGRRRQRRLRLDRRRLHGPARRRRAAAQADDDLRGPSRIVEAASRRRLSSPTTNSPTSSSPMSRTWATRTSSFCRSASIRSTNRGAISRSACLRRRGASASRRASPASSTGRTPPASASSSTGCPAHFPTDAQGLARFDGTALYEHADPRKGFHPDWNTAIYNFGRHEVANFLYCNALYWVDRFHIDGLRVDAVASMLYLDYSRREGEWLPNADGSKENREAIAFLQHANELVYGGFPGAITIAEEFDRLPGRVAADRAPAASASASSGTWAGCTTRSTTYRTIRSIAAGATTG